MSALGAMTTSPLQHLVRRSRRVQWLMAGLVATVALLPVSIFMILELSYVRSQAEQDARLLAVMVASRPTRSALGLSTISAALGREIGPSGFASLRVTGLGGSENIELGQPGRSVLPIRITVPLPAAEGRDGQVEVEVDGGPFLRRAANVFGIHLLVAIFLAVVVYGVPMRALRQAIHEVESTYAQLVHSDRLSAIGETYAGLAHEVNNPLGIIVARVRLLQAAAKKGEALPNLIQDLEVIDQQSSRVAEIVRSLLAFARRSTFELVEAQLNGVITDTVALVERPFAKHGIRIETLLDPSLPALRISPDHLQQVFVNLLNNARDAMPGGGTVTIRTYRNGGRVLAEVQDTGTGVAPEIQERLFHPFFTTKDVGKGTGLGLSVSYGIVKAHGGDIEVDSPPGSGARFRVALPIRGGGR